VAQFKGASRLGYNGISKASFKEQDSMKEHIMWKTQYDLQVHIQYEFVFVFALEQKFCWGGGNKILQLALICDCQFGDTLAIIT
jgi:hypothetical protein